MLGNFIEFPIPISSFLFFFFLFFTNNREIFRPNYRIGVNLFAIGDV